MREEKAFSNRNVPIIIIITLCALLCGILAISFRLSHKITNDLRENAYDSLMNASEIIRQNIDSSMQDDIDLVAAYGNMLRRIDYRGLEEQLYQLCEVNELYHAFYLDAEGEGISETGARFDAQSLPVRETALRGAASVSTGFVGETGQRHLIVQAPIWDSGKVAGALYAEVIATRYYSEETFVFLNGEGRATVFNRSDGDFVIKAPKTILAQLKTDNIFDAVLQSGDSDVYDAFIEKVDEGAKSIIQMAPEGESAYIAILPCKTNPDLYVATIISQRALEVEADSMSRLIVTMQSILIAGMSGLIIMGSVLLYRYMKDRQERATHDLELMYQNRSREELTAALIKAQEANVAKTQFLNNMSHDIRTPMNAIIGMATIAGQNIGDKAKLRDCLSVIASSSHHLLALINDILDVSKIESGNLTLANEPFALPTAIDSVVSIISPLCMAKEQELTVEFIGVEHEFLLGDKTKLCQVLVNLLNNANKFTPAMGSVKLTVEETPCSVANHASYRISVEDNGIGISEENISTVFDPFVRAENVTTGKVEGSGLGLFIAKSIVQAMGGALTLTSELGVGTTFTVTLSAPVRRKLDFSNEYRELNGKRVSVFSQTGEGCEKLLLYLTRIGVMAQAAAYETDEPPSNDGGGYDDCDMAIADLDMTGEDYADTLRLLRLRLGADTPVVAVASGDRRVNEAAALSAGADAFIPKPVFQSRLYDKLAEIEKSKSIHELSPRTLTGRHILVTEDNIVNQDVAKKLLEGAGATLDFANNGQESVDIFTASERGYYDAILMDIQMPVMNGYEAAGIIRKSSHPDAAAVPIIALTAEALSESVERAKEVGINAYLSKPIEPRSMINTLHKLIEKSPKKRRGGVKP